MSGRPYALLWAKTDRAQQGASRHSLVCHMLDVAAAAHCLWHTTLPAIIRDRFAGAFSSDDPDELGRLLASLAGLHDLGKSVPAFQWKLDDPEWRNALLGSGLTKPQAPKTTLKHAFVSAFLLSKETQVLGPQVAGVLGGHHGTFPTGQDMRRVRQSGERSLGDATWRDARDAMRNDYLAALGLSCGDLARFCRQDLGDDVLIALAGLVIVADWIGSASEFFPFAQCPGDLEDYYAESQSCAQHALDLLGWSRPPGPPSPITFKEVFHFIKKPRPLQSCAEATGRDLADGQFVALIEAPMGEGKTEAALYLHDLLAAHHQTAGLYIALPTQATSNQMFERTRDFLASRFPKARANLHLLHSGTVLSDQYQQLCVAANEPAPDSSDDEGAVVAEEWFVPRKRTLLAPFGVGTVDQALLGVLQTRHYYLRLFGLAGKTVVLDEVHAYDTYTSTLIDHLMRWLGALGSSVVILSATLPSQRRRELLEAFCEGAGIDTDVEEAPYPRITAVGPNVSIARTFETRPQKPLAIRWIESSSPLSETLGGLLPDGGCAACICNTVARAQQVYQELRDGLTDTEVYLFHARFPLGQRQKIEKAMLGKFGKGDTHRPHRAVLVATQVVEQSLDLDFDVMLTDMAPVDLLLQRSGRMHRHAGRDRPIPLRNPTLWIRRPSMDSRGLPVFGENGVDERVYGRYLLLESYLAMAKASHVSFPQDVATLVEAVYGDTQTERADSALSRDLLSAREDWAQKQKVEADTGNRRLVPAPNSTRVLGKHNQKLPEDSDESYGCFPGLTRLAPPSVQVVCAFSSGDSENRYLDPACTCLLEQWDSPRTETAIELLETTVRLSSPIVFQELSNSPRPWPRSPLLRHCRLLTFVDCKYCGQGFEIEYSEALGVVINYNTA